MKKLKRTWTPNKPEPHYVQVLDELEKEEINVFIKEASRVLSSYNIEFYEVIGHLLKNIGFNNISITRGGDTNNRIDAIIIDKQRTIPIEIKSPTETEYINIKSVRQALENKIILTSRQFFPSTIATTSLVIGYSYPNERSGVYEAIDDFEVTYGFKIGIISLEVLLELYFKSKRGFALDLERIYNLKGPLKW